MWVIRKHQRSRVSCWSELSNVPHAVGAGCQIMILEVGGVGGVALNNRSLIIIEVKVWNNPDYWFEVTSPRPKVTCRMCFCRDSTALILYPDRRIWPGTFSTCMCWWHHCCFHLLHCLCWHTVVFIGALLPPNVDQCGCVKLTAGCESCCLRVGACKFETIENDSTVQVMVKHSTGHF